MINNDLVRVTMMSNDIIPFFEIYHEVFGMNVVRDVITTINGVVLLAGNESSERRARFIVLSGNHKSYGRLGMLAYIDSAL